MRKIIAAASTVVGGCPGQAFKPQPMEKKPGWRGSPGTPPSAPPPMPPPLPPLRPLVSSARVPVRPRLRRRPPVHTEHRQLPPVWTHLARAFCKRWYCPDCVAPLLTPSSFPASPPSWLLFLLSSVPFSSGPLSSALFPYLPTLLLFLLRRGTVRYL